MKKLISHTEQNSVQMSLINTAHYLHKLVASNIFSANNFFFTLNGFCFEISVFIWMWSVLCDESPADTE